jgi:2,3-bisphosphoglycerate-independent phosphoglycerate mutase
MNKKKVILIIMDGWGLAAPDKFNAIDNAKTPNVDRLMREYPNTRLKSDGLAVGLPEGQFGTSEVNHLTIGAGRIILQDLPRINTAIESGEFYTNDALLKTINHVKKNNSKLHLIGMLSDGGVHTVTDHLFAIFETLHRQKFDQQICLHLFTDGRDVAPKSAEKYFKMLDKQIKKYKDLKIGISTIQGRYYLDRDRDWAKTDKAFNLMRKAEGAQFNGWESVLNFEYNKNNTDEYFEQYAISQNLTIDDKDGVIFYHYRTDRLYQIVKRLIQEELKDIEITTFISVSEEFSQVHLAFPRLKVDNTLAEVISKEGLTQFHITETEKYAHLTFFLNGEKEKEMVNEEWKLIESNRFIKPYYNVEPSMRNFDITKEIIKSIENDKYDFIISNLSSPDMVGHTGNYEAAIVSAEAVDYCIGKIYDALKDKLDDYVMMVTADHGNSDIMWDYENNQPHTQHTTSPVPFILISNLECKLHRRDSLSDIAPTILDLMGIKKPAEMTGESLIIKE